MITDYESGFVRLACDKYAADYLFPVRIVISLNSTQTTILTTKNNFFCLFRTPQLLACNLDGWATTKIFQHTLLEFVWHLLGLPGAPENASTWGHLNPDESSKFNRCSRVVWGHMLLDMMASHYGRWLGANATIFADEQPAVTISPNASKLRPFFTRKKYSTVHTVLSIY